MAFPFRRVAVCVAIFLVSACSAGSEPAAPRLPPSELLRSVLADGRVTTPEWDRLVEAFEECGSTEPWRAQVIYGTVYNFGWVAADEVEFTDELRLSADWRVQQCADRFLGDAMALAPPPTD